MYGRRKVGRCIADVVCRDFEGFVILYENAISVNGFLYAYQPGRCVTHTEEGEWTVTLADDDVQGHRSISAKLVRQRGFWRRHVFEMHALLIIAVCVWGLVVWS